MSGKGRTALRAAWVLACGSVMLLSGCVSASDVTTFSQDFLRELLAAFLF